MDDIVELKRELNQAKDHYLAKFPHLNLNTISKKMDRSFATLKNLLESPTSRPNPDTVLNFMAVVLGKRTMVEVIRDLTDPQIHQYLCAAFPLFKADFSPNEESNATPQFKIGDRETFLIIWFAGTERGIGRDELVTQFGTTINATIDHLIGQEVLSFYEGRLKTVDENIYLDAMTMRTYLPELVRIWDPQNLKIHSVLHAFSEDVSNDYCHASIQKLENVMSEIKLGAKKRENKGEHKLLAAIYGTTLASLFIFILSTATVYAGGIEGGGGTGGGGKGGGGNSANAAISLTIDR